MSDETTKYRAELTDAEIDAGGFAHITACWVEDRRVTFSAIVPRDRLQALAGGMIFTIRDHWVMVGDPEPLPR